MNLPNTEIIKGYRPIEALVPMLLTGNPQHGSGATPEGIANLMNGDRRQHIAFADAGHFISIDQFERFVEAVRQFLEPAF
jgi:hypothetical protein